MDPQSIYDEVSAHYSTAAKSKGRTQAYGTTVARSFGYSDEDLVGAAEESNLGLSCGNPLAISNIKQGETVIDLGSGAGFDAFLAADRVGQSGRVIGVDMNEDMLTKANEIRKKTGKLNTEFVRSRITDISVLESGIADCILSNCVINLVPASEKPLVFSEMFRLLKPGGRLAISDILAKKALPQKLRADVAMYVGCIAGTSEVAEYEKLLEDSGFRDILITDTKSDLNVYFDTKEDGSQSSSCCAPSSETPCSAAGWESESTHTTDSQGDLNEWVGSFRIYAAKG